MRPLEVVEQFIAAFVQAWPEADAASVAAHFSEDAVYHNVPMAPVKGRAEIQAAIGAMMSMGGKIGLEMVHVLANESIVMIERLDHFVLADKTISLPVMGTFEVRGDLIHAWRDYFDLGQFTSQMSA